MRAPDIPWLAGAAEGVLREAARARLSAGDGARAVALASRLVAANPLDEEITEARHRCVRLPDAHLWVEGHCLDALCALAIEHQRRLRAHLASRSRPPTPIHGCSS